MAELPLSGVDVVLMDGAGTDPEWLAESGELDRSRSGSRQRAVGLHPVHIGIDGAAEGRDGGARRVGALPWACGGQLSDERA